MIHSTSPTASKPIVEDRYGRRLSYVRISVTALCNLSCTYCNPVKGCADSHPYKLSWEDLDFLVDVSVNDLGVEAIRITGGEPTIRPGLAEWIGSVNRHEHLTDIAMTTNGVRLAALGEKLCAAGLRRVNISLDTFDAEKFREITRGGNLQRVLDGIRLSKRLFDRVKVNTVLLKDFNIPELERFLRFSDEEEIEVRFIEVMPLWEQKDYYYRNFISVSDVQALFTRMGCELIPEGSGAADGNLTGYGPATTYRVRGTRARLGFISQMSNTKCLSCNKLRLTSDGSLKPCLLSPDEQDLGELIRARDRNAIAAAMRHQFLIREERYDVQAALTDPFKRSMQAIGG